MNSRRTAAGWGMRRPGKRWTRIAFAAILAASSSTTAKSRAGSARRSEPAGLQSAAPATTVSAIARSRDDRTIIADGDADFHLRRRAIAHQGERLLLLTGRPFVSRDEPPRRLRRTEQALPGPHRD